MARPRCHICDRPASVHETVLGSGSAIERHYCTAHGGPVWGAALPKLRPGDEDDIRSWADHIRRDEPRGGC